MLKDGFYSSQEDKIDYCIKRLASSIFELHQEELSEREFKALWEMMDLLWEEAGFIRSECFKVIEYVMTLEEVKKHYFIPSEQFKRLLYEMIFYWQGSDSNEIGKPSRGNLKGQTLGTFEEHVLQTIKKWHQTDLTNPELEHLFEIFDHRILCSNR
jgi:hypothetical protein